MWTAFWERFLQTSSSSSDLAEGPECPCGLARKERATQTHGRSTSLSGREEVDLPWRTRPIRRCKSMKRQHLRYTYDFPSSHELMWGLDYKESWALKNWYFWTVVLEKTLESPLDCKEIQSVHPKGDRSWVFIGRTDVEAESPILWPPDVKSWLVWKDPDAGKDWGQEEKGMTEDEMVVWHHQLNGPGFGWTPGVGDGQGGLACCD